MKKKWIAAGLAAVVLIAGAAGLIGGYQKLHRTQQEVQRLGEELDTALQENDRLQTELAGLKEDVDDLSLQADTWDLIEEGYAKRIRDTLSGEDMMVLGVFPVGEDSEKSAKRFFYCHDSFGEYYLVDYVTGEIHDLRDRTPMVDITSREKDENGNYQTVVGDWDVKMEDYDGNGEEDILLVISTHFTRNTQNTSPGGILLWLQRQGEFVPVNGYYCGIYSERKESEFSVKICDLENEFRKEQNPEDWSVDKVAAWVREELLAGKEDELEAELENPKKKLLYNQWREPQEIHVTLRQDSREQYSVRIPENPYGERQINAWLQEFYEEQEEEERQFMGVGIEENGVVYSEEERKGFFYYSYALRPERVDDVMICFTSDIYGYSGGAHGTGYIGAVVFDTRSGRVLELEDVTQDYDKFCEVVMDYIKDNYEPYGWSGSGYEAVRDVMMGEKDGGWCFTDYGFRIALVGGNGLGDYQYEVPYEIFLDSLKEEYLPVTRAAEYNMYMEGKVRMDVNGDGLLELVKVPEVTDGSIKLFVNDTVTELAPQWGEQSLAELNVRTRSTVLRRQEDGLTRLIWKIDIYGDKYSSSGHVYVYRIEGETFVPEEDYEVTKD